MLISFHRQNYTFGIQINSIIYFLHFSAVNPWLKPKCDRNIGKYKNIVLCGWLFVYFGYMNLRRVNEKHD